MWTIETIKRETSKLVHTLRHVGLEHDNSDVIDTRRVEVSSEMCSITSPLFDITLDFLHLNFTIKTLNGKIEIQHMSVLAHACRTIIKRIDEMLANYHEWFESETLEETTSEDIAKATQHTEEVDEPQRHYNWTIAQCEKWEYVTSNPNWHHVSLQTLESVDPTYLDKKRRDYLKLKHNVTQAVKALYRTKSGISEAKIEIRLIGYVQHLRDIGIITDSAFQWARAKIIDYQNTVMR